MVITISADSSARSLRIVGRRKILISATTEEERCFWRILQGLKNKLSKSPIAQGHIIEDYLYAEPVCVDIRSGKKGVCAAITFALRLSAPCLPSFYLALETYRLFRQ